MTFNVENFNSNVVSRDLLRPSSFVVEITTPNCLLGQFNDAKALTFLCHAAEIPGKQIFTQDVRRFGVGPKVEYPYDTAVVPTNVSFYVDAKDALAVDFIHAWGQKIAPITRDMSESFSGIYAGEVTYRKSYATTVKIIQYNQQNEKIISCELYDTFPKTINAMSLDWNTSDTISLLTTEFVYRAHNIKTKSLADINNPIYNAENDRARARKDFSKSQGFRTLVSSVLQDSSYGISTKGLLEAVFAGNSVRDQLNIVGSFNNAVRNQLHNAKSQTINKISSKVRFP